MNTTDIIKRAYHSLVSAKLRTLLTSLAIAVGTFALTLTLAASNGAKQYADSFVRSNFDPTQLIVTKDNSLLNNLSTPKPQVYNANFGNITSQNGVSRQVQMLTTTDIAKIQKIIGVNYVRPAITINLKYITRNGLRKYVATMESYDDYQKPSLLAGSIPSVFPSKSLILPQGFLSVLGFDKPSQAIGKMVRIAVTKQLPTTISSLLNGGQYSTQVKSKEYIFKIIAVSKAPNNLILSNTALYIYTSSKQITQLYDYMNSGTINYQKFLSVYVGVKNGLNLNNLVTVENRVKKAGYNVESVIDTEKNITQVIGVLQGIVVVFGAIALVASIFGIINTMYISVLQRTREIGLMKALGMHKRTVGQIFLTEAALIGFLGGIMGSISATLLGLLLNPYISNLLGLNGANLLIFNLWQSLALIFVLAIIAILSGLLPAQKATKLDPVIALKTE